MAKIVIANDHGAVDLKKRIVSYLKKEGHDVNDLGCMDETSIDYPDQASKACKEFLKGGYDFGVLFCGTGIGISIAANKIPGIRCALPFNSFSATMAKEHNNANFLAFGGRMDYPEPVETLLDRFMSAQFEGGRHIQRIEKIHSLENSGS